MVGIILAAIGSFFTEISISFGRWEILHKRENIYTYGFLTQFWLLVIFIIMVLFKNNFVFNPDSIPLFAVLIILEFAQTYASLKAMVTSDRSTAGFLMILTIPLLLLVDISLGYKIGIWAILGIFIIVVSLIFLFINHGINKKGIGFVLFSSVNAVATISIYKYLITYYNSVAAQQIISSIFLLIFLYLMSIWKYKENPFTYLLKRKFLFESLFIGIGSVFVSIAYLYAPASIIASGKRAFSILWSVISGNKIFHEKHLFIKIISFLLIIIGLALLVFKS